MKKNTKTRGRGGGGRDNKEVIFSMIADTVRRIRFLLSVCICQLTCPAIISRWCLRWLKGDFFLSSTVKVDT